MFQTILLLVFAAILVWYLARRFPRLEQSSTGEYTGRTALNPFSAVSVYPSRAGCQAVAAIKDKRFLSSEAPELPLAGCDADTCYCIYRHHPDRRTGNGERREPASEEVYAFGEGDKDRRMGLGRREIDNNSDLSWT